MLTPGKNLPAADVVYTPRTLAKDIIDNFNPSGVILDPCKGDGAFYDQLPEPKYWAELQEGVDFLKWTKKVDWIISNPPWSKMRVFLNHSYMIADNVVFLSTMTHFCTKARLRDAQKYGFGLKEFYQVATPKQNWPQSGFQLGAMHLQRGYSGPLHLTGVSG